MTIRFRALPDEISNSYWPQVYTDDQWKNLTYLMWSSLDDCEAIFRDYLRFKREPIFYDENVNKVNTNDDY